MLSVFAILFFCIDGYSNIFSTIFQIKDQNFVCFKAYVWDVQYWTTKFALSPSMQHCSNWGKKLDSFGRINLYLNCYSLVLPLFCDNLEILANTYRGSLGNTASPGGGAVGTLDANVSRRRKRGSSGSVMLVCSSVFWKSWQRSEFIWAPPAPVSRCLRFDFNLSARVLKQQKGGGLLLSINISGLRPGTTFIKSFLHLSIDLFS